MTMTPMSTRGTLLVADISGYTEYLVRAEIEHASKIVGDLLQRIIDSLQQVFVVNRVIGDAVLAWAASASLDGATLMATIDHTYARFRHRALSVYESTSCGCEACGRIPRLDLKVIAHHGDFIRHEVAGMEELSGPDVIIVNRLLKNSLGFSGPDSGYALITAACVEALRIDPVIEGLTQHVERHEHFGEIPAWVSSLHGRWKHRTWQPTTPPILTMTADLPGGPQEAWTSISPGTVPSCVTTRLDDLDEVLEWKPARRLVVRVRHRGSDVVHTVDLEGTGGGTHATLAWYADGPIPVAPLRDAAATSLRTAGASNVASSAPRR